MHRERIERFGESFISGLTDCIPHGSLSVRLVLCPSKRTVFFKKNNFHSTNALLVELSGQVKTADLSWHSIFPPTKTDRFLKPLPASVFPEK